MKVISGIIIICMCLSSECWSTNYWNDCMNRSFSCEQFPPKNNTTTSFDLDIQTSVPRPIYSSLKNKIITANSVDVIKDVARGLSSGDVFFTDCDGVLFRARKNIFGLISALKKEFPNQCQLFDCNYLNSLILRDVEREYVDKNMPEVFDILKQNEVYRFVLTACGRGTLGSVESLENWRIEHLNKLYKNCFSDFFLDERCFEHIAVPNEGKTFKSSKYLPACKNGVIFTCNTPKDSVLQTFLNVTELRPNKIVFVDDDLSNVRLIQKMCEIQQINFVGIHYTANNNRDEAEENRALNNLLNVVFRFGYYPNGNFDEIMGYNSVATPGETRVF